MPFLRYLRTFRGPFCLLCLLSLEFCYICYFCDFCDICHWCFKLARKILVTFAIFAIFADISGPFLAFSFSKSWFLLDLLFLRYLRYLSWVFSASNYNKTTADILWLFLASFPSKSGILFYLLLLRFFAIFVTGVFSWEEKSLLLLRVLQYLRTFRGPSWLLCFLSLECCYICYFCYICDICHGCFWLPRNILVTCAIFAIFADISGPFFRVSA